MPHELDVVTGTTRKAMFSVGETPWHREGTVLTEAPSLAEALQLGGLDFEVVTCPVYVKRGRHFWPSPYGRHVVRADRGEVLGIVGPHYSLLQNRDAFQVLAPLLDKGIAHLETGGSLRGGRDVWMLVRFDVTDPVVQEVFASEVIPFGLVTNNHAGERKACVQETPIRVVCANTLGMALRRGEQGADRAIGVQHTGHVELRIVEAAERLFQGIVERYRGIAAQYKLLKTTILAREEFERLVLDKAAPLPPEFVSPKGQHLTSAGYDRALDVARQRRDAIARAWHNGTGHHGDDSAWEAYNGAVQVIDHDGSLYNTRGSRVAALLGGRLRDRKRLVLNALVEHAKAARG